MDLETERATKCIALQLQGRQVFEKRAKEQMRRALLENEACAMARLSGIFSPLLIDLGETDGYLVLRRDYVPGQLLSNVSRDRWADLLAQLENGLSHVHALGIIHGDLKPENLIVDDDTIIAIDWEHSLPIGAEIEGLPYRAVSPGTSDPRLIWGKGEVSGGLDLYSIDRMREMALGPQTVQASSEEQRYNALYGL